MALKHFENIPQADNEPVLVYCQRVADIVGAKVETIRRSYYRILKSKKMVTVKRTLDVDGKVISEVQALRQENLLVSGLPVKRVSTNTTTGQQWWIQEASPVKNTVESFSSIVQTALESYSSTPITLSRSKTFNKKILFNIITDVHAGMDPRDGFLNYEWNSIKLIQAFSENLESMMSQYNIHGRFEELVIMDLGDSLDGYEGRTTRGGHELPQNMTTEQQFSLVFNCYLNLIEEVLKADICDKLTIHRVENCNHCFTDDVEVLTNNGWKFYKDLNQDYDLVANKNLTSNEIVFDSPLDYILNKDVGCDVHTYKNKNIDLSVTDEHRMLVRKSTSSYSYTQSKELYKKDTTELRFQVSGVNLKKDFAISDDLIKLVAWILTDGSITKGKYGPVGFQITQAKEPTKSMIRQLLTDLGISHRESIVNRITTHIDGKALIKPHKILTEFVINKKQTGEAKLLELLNLISDKKALPEWVWELSKRQFDIFLNVIIAANGNVKVPTSASISGTKNMLDQLQTLCVLNNTKANLLQDNRGDYLLSVVFNKSEITFKTKKQLNKNQYKGDTWCLTMPHGNLVVRRNGRVSIQGNSGTFSQVQGSMLEAFIKRLYPTANINFVRQKDMMAYKIYGDNCIVTTHGKDAKIMLKNMPYFLTSSWETFFTSVFKRWGILDKHIKVFKGDLHRQGMSEHPMFQYYNFKAMSPPSGWVQHNLATTESIGYALHVLGTKRDDYTYIDKNFDFL